MLGIDARIARYTWSAVAILLLVAIVFAVRGTLFIFVLALLFAYLLSPLVDLLDRSLPGKRTRTLALALAYVIFVSGVAMAAIQIGATVVEQAKTLAKTVPEIMTRWQQPTAGAPETFNSIKRQVIERVNTEVVRRSNDLIAAATQAGMKFITFAGDLIFVVVIPILAFFFLKDAGAIRQHILDLADEGPNRPLLDDVMADVYLLLAPYMRALVLISLATLLVYGVAFWITAGILIVVVSAASGGNIGGVAVHPLLVIFGVFAGGEVAGIPGTFLSVPVLALARILYIRFRKRRISVHLSAAGVISQ